MYFLVCAKVVKVVRSMTVISQDAVSALGIDTLHRLLRLAAALNDFDYGGSFEIPRCLLCLSKQRSNEGHGNSDSPDLALSLIQQSFFASTE
jgi:hypothetical protein